MNLISQFYYLLKLNILEQRKSWIFQVIFGLIMPFGMVFIISSYIDVDNKKEIINLFIGNLIISMSMPILLLLTTRLSQMKAFESMDYYRSLPVNMNILTLSLLTSYFITYIPSFFILYMSFRILFDLKISLTVMIYILMLITLLILSLVGIAAYVGIKSKTPEQANVFGNVIFAVLISTNAILIPEQKIPFIFNQISYLFPVKYTINCMKYIINGKFDFIFLSSLLIVFLFSIVSFWLMRKVVKNETDI